MKTLKSVLVLGNSWHSLLVACTLKKKVANLTVTLIYGEMTTDGTVSVRRELPDLLSLLELTQESLLRLCDGTYFLSHHIADEESGREFYWSVDDYGASDEVVDFHQLYERFLWPEVGYDDFCVTAQLSKCGKVIDSQAFTSVAGAWKNEPPSSGLHLNIIPFTELLRRYAEYLGVCVVNNVAVDVKEINNLNDGEVLGSDGVRRVADFVIDASNIQNGFLESNEGALDWTHYFGEQYSAHAFVANEFNSNPTSRLTINSNCLVNTIPLRSGVVYECRGNKTAVEKLVAQPPFSTTGRNLKQSTYGCLWRPWRERKLSLGPAAAHPDNLLVSDLDLLLQELKLLLSLWPSVPFQASLAQEYNRLVIDLYCSVRDVHLLGYWLMRGGELSSLKILPIALRTEIEIFIASSRLPHRDERYPAAVEWIALLMGLKKWPIHYLSINLQRADIEYPDFFQSIRSAVQEIVVSAPSQVAQVNTLLRNYSNKVER